MFVTFIGKHLYRAVFNKIADLRASNFIKKKFQHRYLPVKFAKYSRTPIFNNIYEQLLLYFHYNPHHHNHYHHFRYHCRMHFYCLRILRTIPLDCNMIPWLLWHIFFSSLIPSFLFFMHSKRTQNSFTTTRQLLDVLFTLIFIAVYLYTYIYCYLHLLTYTYLNLLIYTHALFIPLYKLDKIVKIWGI